MSKYATQAESARRMLAAKGQTMTLYRIGTVAAYNPVSPASAAFEVKQQGETVGAVLPATQATISAFDNAILTDPARRVKFRWVLMAAKGLAFEPQADDILQTAEGPYKLLGATPLNPAGDGAIIYSVGATLDQTFVLP